MGLRDALARYEVIEMLLENKMISADEAWIRLVILKSIVEETLDAKVRHHMLPRLKVAIERLDAQLIEH